MCTSRSTPSTPKIDPAPMAVQSADVDTSSPESKKKRRGGRGSTVLEDRGSILGGSSDSGSDKRTFLG